MSSTSPRPKAMVISSFLPFPLDEGDPVRAHMLTAALAEVADVDLVAVLRASSQESDVEQLAASLPNVGITVFPRERRSRLERILGAIKRREPVWIYDRYSEDARAYLSEVSQSYDFVVCEGEAAGVYLPAVTGARSGAVWDKANVLGPSTRRALFKSRSAKVFLRNLLNWPLAASLERRLFRSATAVWVTSDEEARVLYDTYRVAASAVIRSAVDVPEERVDIDPQSNVVAWMSNLQYQPNWAGLVRFLGAAGPLFLSSGTVLRVIGSGLDSTKRRVLEKYEFVDLVGFAPDLVAALEGARCAVIPVWSGAGVKIKTITLMSLGVPVFGTSVALEGIGQGEGIEGIDDPLELATRACFSSVEHLNMLAVTCRETVEAQFTRDAFFSAVAEALESGSRTGSR